MPFLIRLHLYPLSAIFNYTRLPKIQTPRNQNRFLASLPNQKHKDYYMKKLFAIAILTLLTSCTAGFNAQYALSVEVNASTNDNNDSWPADRT